MHPLQSSPDAAQLFEIFRISCMTHLVKESMEEAALDPYVMIRNAYVQNRNKLIAE